MVLLRSDGTPTYMLSVIVDDYDMKVTHVIRGDDHLTNTFRQYQVIQALGWNLPTYAHIPLIHGMDGAKLSKRHGAVGCDYYKELGILSEAMCNYLLRLGWSHGNNEIISREQAVQWFDLDHVGQSPSRFDLKKLINLNAHYLRHKDNLALFEDLKPFLDLKLQEAQKENLFDINDSDLNLGFSRILLGLSSLKERSKTLVDLAESALFYVCPPKNYITDIKSKKFLNSESRDYVINMKDALLKCSSFDHDALELCMKEQASLLNVKLSEIAQPLRLALTGKTVSPSLFEIMEILQKDEVVRRLNTFLSS
jgi:glutamyl-tRNA synthetase